MGRSGGVYIPPFKLARMMKEVEDKSSIEYQRLTWDALSRAGKMGLARRASQLSSLLLEKPTDDSVEVVVGFVTECGSLLQDLSLRGLHGIFERFHGILHEGEIDKRVQFLIEGLFALRKEKFQGYPAIRSDLDLVEQEDQLTHEVVSLFDEIDPEVALDIFKPDPQFSENEKKYEELKKQLLCEESDSDDGEEGE